MFTLTSEEFKSLICQIGISKKGRGGRRKLPMVFTQEGVAMLSSVLHSDRAPATQSRQIVGMLIRWCDTIGQVT